MMLDDFFARKGPQPCPHGDKCHMYDCTNWHPPGRKQKCRYGLSCLSIECQLKRLHPRSKQCAFGPNCTRPRAGPGKCTFAHGDGDLFGDLFDGVLKSCGEGGAEDDHPNAGTKMPYASASANTATLSPGSKSSRAPVLQPKQPNQIMELGRVLTVGEIVVYARTGENVKVVKIHYDDGDPYYTVKMPTGVERQTQRDKLVG